jgi:hypothetical protein
VSDVSLIFWCHTSQPERLSWNHVHQEFRTWDAKDSFFTEAGWNIKGLLNANLESLKQSIPRNGLAKKAGALL